jgi:nicotinamidase-related amidase
VYPLARADRRRHNSRNPACFKLHSGEGNFDVPAKNEDLHGFVPDKSSVALLLIDVINDLEFGSGEDLLRHALPMAARLAALKRRAKEAGVPVIYVNDNFGKWQSDFKKILAHCLENDVRGRPLAETLRPEDEDDYFVLKPKHSGFFSTTLDILLDYLGARTLILTGLTGDICVLFTAHDAYMRDFNLVVPADCVASADPEENLYTLEKMERLLDADIRPSTEIDLEELKRRARRAPEPNPEPESKYLPR